MSVNKNFDFFLEADLSRYSGQWIAISGNRVIASDFNSEAVIEKVNKIGAYVGLARHKSK